MSVEKVYRFDPSLADYIGSSTDSKPTASFGSLFYATDLRQSYLYGSTGWSLWESMYST